MKTSVNLTIVFIVVGCIAIAGIAGGVTLTLYDKDATTFYVFFASMLTTVGGFGGVLYGQNKQNGKLEEVKANTNGNLSRLLDIVERGGGISTRADAAIVHETREKLATDEIPTVGTVA